MGDFVPLTDERAAELSRVIQESQKRGKGLMLDRDNGEVLDAVPVKDAHREKANMISHFDEHFNA